MNEVRRLRFHKNIGKSTIKQVLKHSEREGLSSGSRVGWLGLYFLVRFIEAHRVLVLVLIIMNRL